MWKRDAYKEYEEGHILGAVRFDIAVVAEKESKLPLMLPSPQQFAKQVGEVGVACAERDLPRKTTGGLVTDGTCRLTQQWSTGKSSCQNPKKNLCSSNKTTGSNNPLKATKKRLKSRWL